MISCSLNGKKYTMDFVTGRALREIDDAAEMYRRLDLLPEKDRPDPSMEEEKERRLFLVSEAAVSS